jgi:hypothetical protein
VGLLNGITRAAHALIDHTGITGVGGGSGGGWVTDGSTGSKLDTGRSTLADESGNVLVSMAAGELALAGVSGDIFIEPPTDQIVNVDTGNGIGFPNLSADPATGNEVGCCICPKLRTSLAL